MNSGLYVSKDGILFYVNLSGAKCLGEKYLSEAIMRPNIDSILVRIAKLAWEQVFEEGSLAKIVGVKMHHLDAIVTLEDSLPLAKCVDEELVQVSTLEAPHPFSNSRVSVELTEKGFKAVKISICTIVKKIVTDHPENK